ncbi:DUF6801 domain-containing protein [Streptomyces sp. NPDC058001]|uniref:DUF6801 domain-containing protein n=1 Tax=Streptomyces sp. NPDC058001 TaxID=3346300 RepID=UPI0036E66AD6
MNVKREAVTGTRTGAVRTWRMASVASVALVAGLLSGPGSRAEEAPAPVVIAYACVLPPAASPEPSASDAGTDSGAGTGSGTGTASGAGAAAGAEKLRITVEIATSLPSAATVGKPIQPGPVRVEARLPYAELAPRFPTGTTGLSGDATLGVQVRQNDDTADATWSRLTAQTETPAAEAELRLGHSGEVPTITVGSPGDIELTAGGLTLTVTPTVDGAPADGSATTLTCGTSDPDAAGFARVGVPGDGSPSAPGSSASGAAPGDGGAGRDGISVAPGEDGPRGAETCPPEVPKGDLDLSQLPPPRPGTVLNPPFVLPGVPVCAYAVGLGTVRKLNGSMIINDPEREPALMNVRANMQSTTRREGPFYVRFDSLGALQLPDSRSTFLGFGFTPVTAAVEFETTPITISTGTIDVFPNAEPFAVVTFLQSLRLHDVKVNGTPLDVGPNCRTAKPFRVTLRGDFTSTTGRYINVLIGGLLTGTVDIPAFTGCGTNGEDVSPLFTASISGPGNLITMNQATVCSPGGVGMPGCPPAIPPLPGSKTP